MQFFVRLKNAVIKFEEYQNFSTERIINGIKYFLKLMIIFAVILTIVLTYNAYVTITNAIKDFEESFPNFAVEDNQLVLVDVEYAYIESGPLIIVADSRTSNIEDVYVHRNHELSIVLLQDRIAIGNRMMNLIIGSPSITYEELAYNQNLDEITKDSVLETLNGTNWTAFYGIFIAVRINK